MRDPVNVFHLAIPVHDLDRAQEFYVGGLGCKLARRYEDRITLDFFGDQVVCHLSPDSQPPTGLYPRHFGVTFRHQQDFDDLVRLAKLRDLEVFAAPSVRFAGSAEEHMTFVLQDPSGNLLEFKRYVDPRMMY